MATQKEITELFTSYTAEWNLTYSEIDKAVETALADGVTHETLSNKVICFLYAKDLLPSSSSSSTTTRQKYIELYADSPKLKAIFMTGETKAAIGTHNSLFDKFVEEHPEWKKENGAFVVFRDHPKLKGKNSLVERYMQHGQCSSTNAPIVLQHYLVSMNTTKLAPMLNMAEFWKKHATRHELYYHIFFDSGSGEFVMNPERKWKYLHKYGPALVSGFDVTDNFASNTWFHGNGENRGEETPGRHAMVLVGYRKIGLDKHRYLLQNWWKEKPYVEVDSEYLRFGTTCTTFFTQKQTGMGRWEVNSEKIVWIAMV